MATTYDHLFVTKMRNADADFENEGEANGFVLPDNVGEGFGLMRASDVEQSKVFMGTCWITESDDPATWVHEHVHEQDEVLMWLGGDPADPHDLGAELYLDIEGERTVVTTSGSVYIPAGTRHCPLGWNKVTRPFRFVSLYLNPTYESYRA